MNLRFAFAVNYQGQFEKKHFGDADKYIVYEINNGQLKFVSEENNQFKSMDENAEHGSAKKGKAIIELLKNLDINVLVSRQFGLNIKLINEHFIPIKISFLYPEEVLPILEKHLHWIIDEWESTDLNYKLFTIQSGILKSSIKK
ncbi:MAG: NifB/NifX family molybdenum-iron cluster-binding protein [Bacteroidota bacterium]